VSPDSSVRRSTLVERALYRDRLIVLAGLVAATALAWIWISVLARDMYGAMSGPAAWMTGSEWDGTHIALLFAMWTVMMAGMMLPSAAPALMLFVGVVRRSVDAHAARRAYAFAAGYLLVWTLFAGVAVALQALLSKTLLLSPMMEISDPRSASVVLALAGLYELTPFKLKCLTACQSPVAFVMRHWRPGSAGALRLGLLHGLHCLGCCWALMLLLFVGGVMHLPTIGLITVLVLFEKLFPFGPRVAWFTGTVLLVLAIWLVGQ
jgi:predicted metal-binding membrane protein